MYCSLIVIGETVGLGVERLPAAVIFLPPRPDPRAEYPAPIEPLRLRPLHEWRRNAPPLHTKPRIRGLGELFQSRFGLNPPHAADHGATSQHDRPPPAQQTQGRRPRRAGYPPPPCPRARGQTTLTCLLVSPIPRLLFPPLPENIMPSTQVGASSARLGRVRHNLGCAATDCG